MNPVEAASAGCCYVHMWMGGWWIGKAFVAARPILQEYDASTVEERTVIHLASWFGTCRIRATEAVNQVVDTYASRAS
jgi:hypothetical protein